MGYTYKADVYCDDCGDQIRGKLHAQGKAPEDTMDHSSYDSDDFPKSAYIEREESDVPEHCAQCKKFLRNPLTSAGYENVRERLNDTGLTSRSRLSDPLHDWAGWYDFTYCEAEDCADDSLGKHPTPGWYSSESY
jgi:hypothetical protein